MTLTPREVELVLAEREACAKVAETKRSEHQQLVGQSTEAWSRGYYRATTDCAYYIRSRPQPSAPTGQAEPVASKDTARLDFLDRLNASLNKRYNTNYRWELIFNHNVTRLMLGGHLVVDLNDTKHNGAHSCRDAIDAKMREHGVNIASPTPPDGYRVGDE